MMLVPVDPSDAHTELGTHHLLGDAVIKETKRKGAGPRAVPGDRVLLHYTGVLADGTVFDTSRRRGPFSFMLGYAEVIPGWDLGVATMREGEAAVLTVDPSNAYGEHGSGSIPPNATLTFEIEVLKVGEDRSCGLNPLIIMGALLMVAVVMTVVVVIKPFDH